MMRENHGFFFEFAVRFSLRFFVSGGRARFSQHGEPRTDPHFAIFHSESVNYACLRQGRRAGARV
ncbi:MAG: hypothetical protein ABFC56_04120 [Clostridiaceae bacterium]